MARGARLRFVSDDEPGISRIGRARFRYVDATSGQTVGAAERARIQAIAIPPAWTDVWICPDPDGHIQATGRDDRGRKQYRYHADFRARRERLKFHALVPFGKALGPLRARIDADLRSPTLSRERVLAAMVSLLQRTYVRIGNDSYARANRTYGLSTLRCKHVDVDGATLAMCFVGKGGKRFEVQCCDARLARVVRRCRDLPGQVLFQYLDDDGEPVPVSSTDVNDYLRAATGVDATAKTFRTWGATLLAAQQLVLVEPPASPSAAARAVNDALRPVAEQLGNTLAVCKASYVHPIVIEEFTRGRLPERWEAGPRRRAGGLEVDERRLLHLLSDTP
jgi:DNA topoisomerase-1